MKTFLAFLATPLFATTAALAATPSVAGNWAVHSSISGNESDLACTFTQNDTKLSGSCKSADDKVVTITGTVEKAKISFAYTTDYNGSPLTLTYTGTPAADKMSGTVDVQPFAVTGDWTATLVAPAAK